MVNVSSALEIRADVEREGSSVAQTAGGVGALRELYWRGV
jgi:hypothetical protein